MEQPGRFTIFVLALVGVGLLATAAVNLVIDPYDVYRLVGMPRFDGKRPAEIFHDRMHKAHELRRRAPDGILLGTSRTQVGLDPASPVFRGRAEHVVNAALSYGQPSESLRYLQHARAVGPVRLAVMGLDFLGFDVTSPPTVEFSGARLAVGERNEPQPLSVLADVVPTLLSVTALRASVYTIRNPGTPSYFREGGQRNAYFMEARVLDHGGVRRNAMACEREYLDYFSCYRGADSGQRSSTLADLARLVRFCADQGIALRLFFSPIHARHQLLIRAAGLWPAQEAWKRAVVDLVNELGRGHDVELWDFTGAGRYTAEAVPPPGDERSRMAWYWESSHYTSSLGELVLARVLHAPDTAGRTGSTGSTGTTATTATGGFGVRLDADDAAREMARINAELDAFAAANPDVEREIAAAAADVLPASRAAKGCGPPPAAAPLRWQTVGSP